MEVFLDFLRDPAPVIGLSCMANLLPFTILAMRALQRALSRPHAGPRRRGLEGGRGEAPRRASPGSTSSAAARASGPARNCCARSSSGGDLAAVAGHLLPPQRPTSSTRPTAGGSPTSTRSRFPAFEKVDLTRYAGYGMMTSRGCPYPCTFCSVAPVWNLESYSRGPKNIVDEMEFLNREAGVDLFLFQDEFFVSGKTAGDGVLPRAASPRPERAVEGLRPRQPGRRRDDAGDGRQRLRRAAVRHRVGLRPRAASRSRRASPPPRRSTSCPRPSRSSPASMPSSSGASPSRRWRTSTSRSSRWSRSA